MRNNVIDTLLIGAGIGFIALALHRLTDDSPASFQLVALVLAGIALFCLQIALTIRRSHHASESSEAHPEGDLYLPTPRHSRRNPFFRELTYDWTGLDEHGAEQGDAPVPPWDDQGTEAPNEPEL